MALDVDPTVIAGGWWRHVPAGVDPGRRPDPPGDNRWQHGEVVDALYLAQDVEGVWAEWYRHLAEAAIPPQVALPRDLWRYQVTALEVADLSDPARLARVGLGPPRPGRRGWPDFQAVGEELSRKGWTGLVAPSAARPTSLVLAVFLPGGAIPGQVEAVEATRIADVPIPPTGLQT